MLHYNDKTTSYFGKKRANLTSHLVSRKHYPQGFPLTTLSVFAGDQGWFQLDHISFTSFPSLYPCFKYFKFPIKIRFMVCWNILVQLPSPPSHLKGYMWFSLMPVREGTLHACFYQAHISVFPSDIFSKLRQSGSHQPHAQADLLFIACSSLGDNNTNDRNQHMFSRIRFF